MIFNMKIRSASCHENAFPLTREVKRWTFVFHIVLDIEI